MSSACTRPPLAVGLLAAALLPSLARAEAPAFVPAPAVCFHPDTPPEVVEEYAARARASSLQPGGGDDFEFPDGARWTQSATNPCCLRQGDPMVLTWSIVPDGTSICGFNGEATAPSNLQATLDAAYGSRAAWEALFQAVFDRWGALTGITYVRESDDGAAFSCSTGSPAGARGVRGDVRISGHRIDGRNNVLAYNFFPAQGGEMIIDTTEDFAGARANNSRFLRNIVAHEHGHGLGMNHVCPINETKLMEPFLSLRFDLQQLDDTHAGNRGYGDDLEPNDAFATASDLGVVATGSTITREPLSIDDNADVDLLRFSVAATVDATVTVAPLGASYLSGPQNANGSCSAGSTVDSLRVHNLVVELYDASSSLLGFASSRPAGEPETLTRRLGPGSYTAVVYGGASNAAQLYRASVSAVGGTGPTLYESTLKSALGSPVGQAAATPYDHAPAAASELYYQMDDGAGNPALIRLTRGGSGILVHF